MRKCFQHGYLFQNHAAAFQHSFLILITNGEKIVLLYATFTYISSHYQKYLQISLLWTETDSHIILLNSVILNTVYSNLLYYKCFEVLMILILFLIDDLDFFHILIK